MRKTWVGSLGWDDPLEKGMATHSSILAWEIPWTEEPGGLQSMGSQRVGHDGSFRYVLFQGPADYTHGLAGCANGSTVLSVCSCLPWLFLCYSDKLSD